VSDAVGTVHDDPIAPVILGVTSILAFAVLGRGGAKRPSTKSSSQRLQLHHCSRLQSVIIRNYQGLTRSLY
jgi:hypothetical protein